MNSASEKTLTVTGVGQTPYSVMIKPSFAGFCEAFRALRLPARRVCVVTDSRVGPLYAEKFTEELMRVPPLREDAGKLQVSLYTFTAGEEHKTLDQIRGLYEHLIQNSFDRKDLLIALGGGVTGDMCGFAAATYQRGIDFIQVPTTLLSQVDSSVGGKTGVDFSGYKNMVGAFHMPVLVYISLDTLDTLPKDQFESGMAEVIKHGLIKDAAYTGWLEASRSQIISGDTGARAEMVFRSIQIKSRIVGQDPTEQGERRLLNFGHTLGHAIERESGFALGHGQCVALGCCAAARMSCLKGLISPEDVSRVRGLFSDYGLPVTVKGLDKAAVMAAMKRDKKKQGDTVPFILLDRIGDAFVCGDIGSELIETGLESIFA